MKSRNITPPQQDDRDFPVRLGVRVPTDWYGSAVTIIAHWLDEHIGRGQWAWHSGGTLNGGAMPEGKKELVGFQVGLRDSAQCWHARLTGINGRGLAIAPDIAVGDGAMGALSQRTAKLMVFTLIQAASKKWLRLKGKKQLPKLIEGTKFIDGVEVTNAATNRAA